MTKNHPELSRTSSFFHSVLCMVIASIALPAQTAFADLITPVGVIASVTCPQNRVHPHSDRTAPSGRPTWNAALPNSLTHPALPTGVAMGIAEGAR